MNNPITGIRYLFKGFNLIKQPGLRKYVVIPLLFNILIFAGLGYLAFGWMNDLIDQMMQDVPAWLQWLNWLIWIIISAGSVILLYFTFTVLANFISAPFNGVLSEAVEEHVTGAVKNEDTPWHQALVQVGPALKDEVAKLSYSITRSLPFFVLFFIPGINFAASALWMLFGAWMMAIQYADYPFGNQNILFKDQRKLLKEKRLLVMGFGGAVMLCTMIPVINLIIIPAAVAGATVMYLEQFKSEAKA